MPTRVQVGDLAIAESIQPAASPVDVFVRPRARSSAVAEQLSAVLESSGQGFENFFKYRQKETQDRLELEAKQAALIANGLTQAEAIKQGLIKPNQSPFYQRVYATQEGGIVARQRVTKAFDDLKNTEEGAKLLSGGDHAAFEDHLRKTSAEIFAGINPAAGAEAQKEVETYQTKAREEFDKLTNERLLQGRIDNYDASVSTRIDQFITTLSKDPKEQQAQLLTLWENIQTDSDIAIKAQGVDPKDANEHLLDILSSKAKEFELPQLLDIGLTRRDYATGKLMPGVLRTSKGQQALQTVQSSIESAKISRINFENAQQDRAQKQANQQFVEGAAPYLAKNEPIPDEVLNLPHTSEGVKDAYTFASSARTYTDYATDADWKDAYEVLQNNPTAEGQWSALHSLQQHKRVSPAVFNTIARQIAIQQAGERKGSNGKITPEKLFPSLQEQNPFGANLPAPSDFYLKDGRFRAGQDALTDEAKFRYGAKVEAIPKETRDKLTLEQQVQLSQRLREEAIKEVLTTPRQSLDDQNRITVAPIAKIKGGLPAQAPAAAPPAPPASKAKPAAQAPSPQAAPKPEEGIIAPFLKVPDGAPQGQPRGLQNNNPGNIRKSGIHWQGEVPGKDGSFETFATPEDGIRALARNLLTYYSGHGLNTVTGILDRYAPPGENDTGSYIKAVSGELGIDPNHPLDLKDIPTMSRLVTAIIRHEQGTQPFSEDVIAQATQRAYGEPTQDVALATPATKPAAKAASVSTPANYQPPRKAVAFEDEDGVAEQVKDPVQLAKLKLDALDQ